MGFAAETSTGGLQHRWRRDLAQIDVHAVAGKAAMAVDNAVEALARLERAAGLSR